MSTTMKTYPNNTRNNNHSTFLFSSPPDSLSLLSDSLTRLTATISNSHPPTDSSRDTYLNSTISVLTMCNAVLEQAECLKSSCLRLRFACHLLSSPSTADRLRCARKALSEWGTILNGSLASAAEVARTNAAVRRLSEAIDGADGENGSERLRIGVGEVEILSGELNGALDRLTAAVNELFNMVMGSRNVVIESYKIGPRRCK